MNAESWMLGLVTAVSPLLIALIGSVASRGLTINTRAERQIRQLSELIDLLGDQAETKSLHTVRRETVARYASRLAVPGYQSRVVMTSALALLSMLITAVGLVTVDFANTLVGVAYSVVFSAALIWTVLRVGAYRDRARIAILKGRPSGAIPIDADLSVPRNVRRARALLTNPRAQ